MKRKITEVNYEHKIWYFDNRKTIAIYQNGKGIKEIPFRISLRRTIRSVISEIFHDVPYDLNYTSTDRDSGRVIQGHYISPLSKKMALRRKINVAKRRLNRLLNI